MMEIDEIYLVVHLVGRYLARLRVCLCRTAGLALAAVVTAMFPVEFAKAEKRDSVYYRVQAGETLSQILFRCQVGPLYGSKGYVAKIANSFSMKVGRGGNLIKAGDVLLIPCLEAETASKPESGRRPAQVAPPLIERPVAKPTESSADAFSPFGQLSVNAGASYLSLDGRDPRDGTHAQLLSGLSPRVELGWRQNWNERFQSRLSIGIQSLSLEPDEAGAVIKNAALTTSGFGVAARYRHTPRLTLTASAEIAQTLFYRALTTTVLEVNQVPLLKLSPGASWEAAKSGPFSLSLFGDAAYWSSSSYGGYAIRGGLGYAIGLVLSQELKGNGSLSCRMKYDQRRQDTSIVEISQREVGVLCGYDWVIGL